MHRSSSIASARLETALRATALAALLSTGAIVTGCSSAPGYTIPASPLGKAVSDEAGHSTETARLQRQLVRRGHMGVAVADLAPARTRLERAAGAMGAEVSRAEVSDDTRAEYVLRVPPAQLNALMDSIAALGEVDARVVSADDVTEVVVDAEARLAALRASRDRLTQLLDQATSVTDVISVERELARVQGEIESLDGRLRSLKSHVAMSELTANIHRKPVLGPLGVVLKGVLTVVEKLFVWR